MKQTAQVVSFKEAKAIRKKKPLEKSYEMDFSKFKKLLDMTKKE